MPENTVTRLPLTSHDSTGERLRDLRELFPDAFTEGVLDADKLKQLIGQTSPAAPERYGLSWAGKAEALRAVQALSTGTLRPEPDQSVDFATTGNLIIEGDNLEVLKLLQKSYHRRVKMIYIDPPYNTGNEFIYPDNFREGLQTYLEYTGQVKNGVRQTTNSETSGRYHSNWLSMMYPRLFLARNLLRDDGVIFVSIDDHEVHNLRLLMNEVFGEENFIAVVVWQKKYAPSNDTVDFSYTHDYIMVYGKQRQFTEGGKAIALLGRTGRTEEQNKLYKNPDNDPRGVWASDNYLCNKSAEERPNLYYPIIHPKSGQEIWPSRTAVWRYSKQRHEQNITENRIWWGVEQENQVPRYKRFISDVSGVISDTWWQYKDSGHNDEAKKQIKALFPDLDRIFDTPKPTRLLKRILKLATSDDGDSEDIILDFFAGSGTMAQAVMELNAEDGGNRKFILVQLPEATGREDFPTIADITRERVRRAARQLTAAEAGRLPDPDATSQDRGFKALTLDTSNFKVWDADAAGDDSAKLAEQLQLYADHRVPNRSEQDVLYELLLKTGRSLTAPIATRQVAGQTVYDVDGGQLLICLADPIREDTLRGMIALRPERVLCLDAAFEGNDQLKTNIVLTMRDAEIEFRTV